ncbi:MAG: HAMP domain-containing protein, partial [Gemmataceae bacterium]
MPRLSIAQRLALLVAGVALVMTVAICLLSFLRGRAVLADHVTADLADKCNLRMFEVREEFRYISREVRDSAAAMPKPGDGQAPAAYVADGRFDAAWHELFARLLRWADEHGRTSPWNWVDRDIFLEAYFLAEDADGGSRVLKALRREDGGVAAFDPDHEPPLAQAALADVQAQVRAAAKRKAGQPRQFTSQVRSCRDTPHRRTVCIGYEFAGQPGQAGGLLAVAIDFTRMIANETHHSPRHLFFVADKDGTYLAHPDPAKVGTRIPDDRDARGKPTFAFRQVPWAAVPPDPDSERTEGESQFGVTVAGGLHYEISRKTYDRGSPFRDEAQRAALERDLDGLGGRDPQFRFTRPRADNRFFAISTPDPKMMSEATRLVDAHEKAAASKGGGWDGPVECQTFAAHIAAFRLGMERAGGEESGETLYLIVTTALDEIDHDIWRTTRWVLWASLLLCVGAAALALVPARLITRPLDRIREAAGRLAEGDYAVDLPVGSHTEIGHLA